MLPSSPERLRIELEHFMRDILPQPGYVILTSELATACHNSFWGVAGNRIACWHRAELEAAGRWHGPGPGFLLHDRVILEQCLDWYELLPIAAAVAAHEMGHLIETCEGAFYDADSDPSVESAYRKSLSLGSDPCRDLLNPDASKPAWHLHDRRFIRASLHIACRLIMDDWPLDLGHVFYGSLYGLSSPFEYLSALGDEPQVFCSSPLTEVLKLPEPIPFSTLWASDISPATIKRSDVPAAHFRGMEKPATSRRKRKVASC